MAHSFVSQSGMGGKLVRSIGKARAEVYIGLRNLAYNIKRYIFLEFQGAH